MPVGGPPGRRASPAGEVTLAPAHGPTLIEVGYPPDPQLAARAEATRRARDESDISG
jgi:tRNA pseudouridine38-40 synthase